MTLDGQSDVRVSLFVVVYFKDGIMISYLQKSFVERKLCLLEERSWGLGRRGADPHVSVAADFDGPADWDRSSLILGRWGMVRRFPGDEYAVAIARRLLRRAAALSFP